MNKRWNTAVALVATVSLALVQGAAFAQAAADKSPERQEYQPQVGQAGKDVVWVPTPDALVERMLKMAQVTSKDYVIDLGSGDGRTVIAAVQKFGATALGIEYNPDMVALSVKAAEKAGVSDKAKFIKADIFETDFSKATVITMYLLPALNIKLRPKLLDMRPGTRIVSHAFNMEDWQPDQTATVEGRDAFLWIVPAKVQGNWALSVPAGNGGEQWQVALNQNFQKLSGTAKLGDRSYSLTETRLRGADVAFAFVDGNGIKRQFTGRASGDKMEGTTAAQGGAKVTWTATRGGR
ncbi:MAG TPA: class I SAM-dependent methyltransferase [Burkholderiales bacterium]|nr:class I SAM-dependent methyltransferase [Burkholderiales bacterium]